MATRRISWITALALSQATMAEATGISAVHINRMFQALRQNGLISLRHGKFETKDWEGLVCASRFNPNYLHVYRNVT